MAIGGNTVPRIEKSEHIGPDDTGDNIQAKRVAVYKFNKSTLQWERDEGDLTPGTDYDKLVVVNTSGTSDRVTFKLNTTTVRVMDITYTTALVEKVSDELVEVDFS